MYYGAMTMTMTKDRALGHGSLHSRHCTADDGFDDPHDQCLVVMYVEEHGLDGFQLCERSDQMHEDREGLNGSQCREPWVSQSQNAQLPIS